MKIILSTISIFSNILHSRNYRCVSNQCYSCTDENKKNFIMIVPKWVIKVLHVQISNSLLLLYQFYNFIIINKDPYNSLK